jgi:hypothetical protein
LKAAADLKTWGLPAAAWSVTAMAIAINAGAADASTNTALRRSQSGFWKLSTRLSGLGYSQNQVNDKYVSLTIF